MNARLTRSALLLGTCFASFAAHATVHPATQATTDQAAAAFERMLSHQAITTRPAQQGTSGAPGAATSTTDPLLDQIVAALRPTAK